ncbi:hypothetical protein ACOBV9_19040 (plasmid) [Pseudoalteromonas espejiana]
MMDRSSLSKQIKLLEHELGVRLPIVPLALLRLQRRVKSTHSASR